MIANLVVPLDGSALAEQALPAAVAIARESGAALRLVHVRRATAYDETDADAAHDYVERVRERVEQAGVTAYGTVIPDEPPQLLLPTPSPGTVAGVITFHVGDVGGEGIVMTTHGRGGLSRKWFGSVADSLLRSSPVPILLIKPIEPDDEAPAGDVDLTRSPAFARVLVAVAPDDEGREIVRAASLMLGPVDPHYTLLRVMPMPYTIVEGAVPATVVVPAIDPPAEREAAMRALAECAAELPDGTTDVVTLFEVSPARGILDFAEEHNPDVVVVGTHSRRGIDRFLLGSVADKVMRGADAPVLVVPPRPEAAPS